MGVVKYLIIFSVCVAFVYAVDEKCVKCTGYEETCKGNVNTTTAETCTLAAGQTCETYSYTDATGIMTVRDCVADTTTCGALRTENEDKITDKLSWACKVCKEDLCNDEEVAPDPVKCIQCSDQDGSCKTKIAANTAKSCALTTGQTCEMYSYKDANGVVSVRDCVADTTCEALRTANEGNIVDKLTWSCKTCIGDLCNAEEVAPDPVKCIQCSDQDGSCKTKIAANTAKSCALTTGQTCEMYSYKDANGVVSVRDCVADTTCEALRTANEGNIVDKLTWSCKTCIGDLCNAEEVAPDPVNCIKCTDKDGTCKTKIAANTADTCPLTTGQTCEMYSYKDTNGVVSVRDCVADTTCEALRTANEGNIVDKLTWACKTCIGDLCNAEEVAPDPVNCIKCTDKDGTCKTKIAANTADTCPLTTGQTCEMYSYKDTNGVVSVRDCVADTTCEALRTANEGNIVDKLTWACKTCIGDLCNAEEVAPDPVNCIKCTDKDGTCKTKIAANTADTCPLTTGQTCETYSYKDATGILTVRDCVADTTTCASLKTANKDKITDERTWACNICNIGDLCNAVEVPAEPVNCYKCNEHGGNCQGNVDPTKLTTTCQLTTEQTCETYSYKDDTGIMTVRDCVADTTTCGALRTENENKITDKLSWACDTCIGELCNAVEVPADPVCYQCNGYGADCQGKVNSTKVQTKCQLKTGQTCETYSYKDATGLLTVRDCVADTTCAALKTANENKITDKLTWACDVCKEDLCNAVEVPAEPVNCYQCNEHGGNCQGNVDPTKLTTTCQLKTGQTCETYSYKDAEGLLTVRDCVNDTTTCATLKTTNKDKITDVLTWACNTCIGDLCNAEEVAPDPVNCYKCNDNDGDCKGNVDPTKVTTTCQLQTGQMCETYSYKDATGIFTFRDCVANTTTCDSLKTANKDKITDETTWACNTCIGDLCNAIEIVPAASHCIQCSDHDGTCADTVDTSKVTGRCDLVDGLSCERHSYEDSTGTLTTRDCIAKTTSCENLKTFNKGKITSDSSWTCYTCDKDMCNQDNAAGSIGLSLLSLIAGTLISLYMK